MVMVTGVLVSLHVISLSLSLLFPASLVHGDGICGGRRFSHTHQERRMSAL